MPDLGPILANLVSMDLESFWGFDQRERFKAFRFYLRPSHRLSILFFFSLSLLPSFFSYALTSFIESSLEEKSLLAASFFHSCKLKLRFLYFLSSISFSFFLFLFILPNSFLIPSFAKVYSRFKIYSQNRTTSDRVRGTRRKREI